MIVIMADVSAAQATLAQAKANHLEHVYAWKNRVGFANLKRMSEAPFINEQQVVDVILDHPAAMQVSRTFHPDDMVIQTKHSIIGSQHFNLIAGPDAIESAEHVLAMGKAAKAAGATILRGGSYKPRTSPYSFQGLGEQGLVWHRAAADTLGMDMMTEIMSPADVELVGQYTDIFQVGTRNMQNFSLLKALGRQNKPVLLKRGMSATVDEFLSAAEYIASEGNQQIILMERGIRSFDQKYLRNTMDVSVIPVLQKLTHLPVLADPSHAAGVSDHVTPIGLAAVAAGAQGLMIEIHDQPAKAWVDGKQALTPDQMMTLFTKAKAIHEL
ncbi:3-deoxy-7-phosphoheptulonate synthase [Weissella paramesenteroides]|uniref:3-deoxy-7-phosphoheptulonate synthase n=1 Tax=Weissella paramesenteroides TaxID=1249 RepID=UPI0012391CE3|nr:3-deoxy-7-phosphoheptulonate synthase [Weissella paramesenteroides]KAA8456380.1 3-deoxy-7-phosphoheptulonate synthase [Weissella paramesenteroides]KAA8456676.1 3-deoxy-7-phosphoheptulonate synthase [Weissella paramesenteroides]KAA8459002.1 3-deoxy-7-phosphoheptulonate synthase [Weissella paramesenteroides]KAA8463408.1 3-deoxy-7-phosphoheptulonate synthase [Weissella paramesenteroides]KAA8465459.1 3-deoxy-7-phosphoheptulonate synthase [Weissella paramesenteroides]